MINLIFEDVSSKEVFDLSNAGNYVEDYLPTTKVGNVSGYEYQKFEKLRDGKIVYMTADEYIDRCANDIFKISREDAINSARNPKNIDLYADKMLTGEVFPVCYLDYVYRQQEGRHRALAFKKAFGAYEKFPVLIVTKTSKENTTLQDVYDYCSKKWSSDYIVNSFFESISENIGYSERDINEFLGRYYDEEPEEDEFEENEFKEDNIDNISWDDLDLDDEFDFQ